jgi:parallel beta-helix repeat protein
VAGKIVLSAGSGITLPALSRLVNDPAALRETAPGEWLLGADLEIGPGASLAVTAPAVRRLDLSSAPGRFVAVRVLGGKLAVTGTCVTSWDPGAGKADIVPTDGRSFLLARDGATMTVDRAELRFLGFGEVESYGLSWRTKGTTGRVTDSIISNLYYGVYSYEVGGLVVTGNEVYASTVYGIDPHTSSHDMTITNNIVHDNGKHGIILAEDCVNSMISDNVVYANGQHGIVLYQRSNGNVVERNESFRNGSQGINVNESSGNAIRDNKVYDNTESGIAVAQSSQDNVLERNDVRSNQQDGVRLVSRSGGTTVRDNVIGQNIRYGVYLDVTDPFTLSGNTIFRSRYGISTSGTADVPASANTLFGNTDGDVRVPK